MQQIWNNDEAEFHGRHLDFDLLLPAGWGPTTFRRIVERADDWLAPPDLDAGQLGDGVRQLRTLADEHGRDFVVVVA